MRSVLPPKPMCADQALSRVAALPCTSARRRHGEAADEYDRAARGLTRTQAVEAGYLAALERERINDVEGALESLRATRVLEAGSCLREVASGLEARLLVAVP